MKELEYPFDSGFLLGNRKKLRRALLNNGREKLHKRIAILGGYTTKGIAEMMELFLLNQDIAAEFYESEYNRFYEDAVFSNDELEAFMPDVIYFCTSNRNIRQYPRISDTAEAIDQLLGDEEIRFKTAWDSVSVRFHCPVIQNNFEMPLYRLLGNRDIYDIHGAANYLYRLNGRFYEYAVAHEDFHICDINYISADYGLARWSDPFYWHMYKYALNVNAVPYLAFNVAGIVKSLFGKNKKSLVLDLDNTLWGGVVGEDGAKGIKLGHEEPEGQTYLEFQNYIRQHKELGILLNVNSKNDLENAVEGLQHPDSLLKPDDFIEIKANWEPKDRNFRNIAQELNIAYDSMVFVDDNPAERHIVTEQIEGVSAPNIGEPHQYILRLDRNLFFEQTVISGDDLVRDQMYRENVQRRHRQNKFADYDEYLKSLAMTAVIKPFDSMSVPRVTQLANKSNQFNLTTRRYTQSEIEAAAADSGVITLYGSLRDCFGDNGIVSVVIGSVEGGICRVKLWLMSCRVLKRGMENAMMDALIEACVSRGVRKIAGYYYPTSRNGMVKDFYRDFGFTKTDEDENGNTVWELELKNCREKFNRMIQVERGEKSGADNS